MRREGHRRQGAFFVCIRRHPASVWIFFPSSGKRALPAGYFLSFPAGIAGWIYFPSPGRGRFFCRGSSPGGHVFPISRGKSGLLCHVAALSIVRPIARTGAYACCLPKVVFFAGQETEEKCWKKSLRQAWSYFFPQKKQGNVCWAANRLRQSALRRSFFLCRIRLSLQGEAARHARCSSVRETGEFSAFAALR